MREVPLHRMWCHVAIIAVVALLSGTANTARAGAPSYTVTVWRSPYGPILTDQRGLTLYVYQLDTPGVSNCRDQCLDRHPPLTSSYGLPRSSGAQGPTDGPPTLDPSASGTLTFIVRDDGTQQIAYNGKALYRYFRDMNPGDVLAGTDGPPYVWSIAQP
jgi:predicted lipoprotein with Yx(FWY)xxD motif